MATITDLKIKVDTSELTKAIELIKEYKSLTESLNYAPLVNVSVYESERDLDFSGSYHDKIIEAINKNRNKDKQ